jgi:hypothetical protein
LFKKIIMAYLLIVSSVTYADTLKDQKEIESLAKSVMDLVAKGKFEEGIRLAKPYVVIPDHEIEGMINAYKMQAPAIEQRFGKSIGTELVTIEKSGDSLILLMYIQKFEKHAMRWRFYFYKPKNSWILSTFNTDDKIQLMFQTM